jgi:hypothetical protein
VRVHGIGSPAPTIPTITLQQATCGNPAAARREPDDRPYRNADECAQGDPSITADLRRAPMPRFRQFPPALLARATWLRLRGRVHFPRDTVGDVIVGPREEYQVFRKMVVDPPGSQPGRAGAQFEVDFHFARFSPTANQRLSRLPMPLIAAQPGFRSKTWMQGRDSGAFKGLYEWNTVEDAEEYWNSFPMRLMKRRAVPETLSKEIRPIAG